MKRYLYIIFWYQLWRNVIKEEIGSRNSSKDRQYNGQKKKNQKTKKLSTKHYSENNRSSNMNPTKNSGCSWRVDSTCFTYDTVRITVKRHVIIWYGNRVRHQYMKMNANTINKAWTPYKTNGSQDKFKIVFTRKS